MYEDRKKELGDEDLEDPGFIHATKVTQSGEVEIIEYDHQKVQQSSNDISPEMMCFFVGVFVVIFIGIGMIISPPNKVLTLPPPPR